MNPTPEIPPAENVLKAAMAEQYVDRIRTAASMGSKTERVEEAAKEYASMPDMMSGAKAPSQVINEEKPHHILMCYMMAGGKTIEEIAAATGYTRESVRIISRQPWFRKRFLRITAEAGKNQIEAFLANETLNSLETLVEIRDREGEKGATRVAAANSILDRALGKPVAKIESETTINVNKATQQGNDLDRQIAAAEEELKRAVGHRSTTSGSN